MWPALPIQREPELDRGHQPGLGVDRQRLDVLDDRELTFRTARIPLGVEPMENACRTDPPRSIRFQHGIDISGIG